MKNRNIIWYAGYVVSLLLILLIALSDFHFEFDLALSILFAAIFSISHIQLIHNKMLREDRDYKTSVLDERNLLIKEKSGNVTNMITLVLLGITTVLFIALDYFVPAIVIGVIIFTQPVVLMFVSNAIEKRM